MQTPKGLISTCDTGLYLSLYIENYKGGIIEFFMFGCEEANVLFDYDLVSASCAFAKWQANDTTGMKDLPLPSYKRGQLFSTDKFQSLSSVDLLHGYYIINATLKFPPGVKYLSRVYREALSYLTKLHLYEKA